MKRNDSEIRQAVLRELKRDARVDGSELEVSVDAGVVTLSGRASSLAKKTAAQDAAHRVREVLDVANDIDVRAAGVHCRTDTELARAVRLALEWDAFVPEMRIRSTVSDGWVTLEGNVDHYSQREDAERAVRGLRCVRGIANEIKIDATVPLVPNELEAAIQEALARHAMREARRVNLEINQGRVTVFGDVDSWAERQAIIGAVKGTAGVRAVDDRLRVPGA